MSVTLNQGLFEPGSKMVTPPLVSGVVLNYVPKDCNFKNFNAKSGMLIIFFKILVLEKESMKSFNNFMTTNYKSDKNC